MFHDKKGGRSLNQVESLDTSLTPLLQCEHAAPEYPFTMHYAAAEHKCVWVCVCAILMWEAEKQNDSHACRCLYWCFYVLRLLHNEHFQSLWSATLMAFLVKWIEWRQAKGQVVDGHFCKEDLKMKETWIRLTVQRCTAGNPSFLRMFDLTPTSIVYCLKYWFCKGVHEPC